MKTGDTALRESMSMISVDEAVARLDVVEAAMLELAFPMCTGDWM